MQLKRMNRRSNDHDRPRRLAMAAAARRRLEGSPPVRGRVWLNGREVGAETSRYDYLGHSHD